MHLGPWERFASRLESGDVSRAGTLRKMQCFGNSLEAGRAGLHGKLPG